MRSLSAQRWLEDSLTAIGGCRPGQPTFEETTHRLEALGLHRSLFLLATHAGPVRLVSTMPGWWQDQYREEDFGSIDPFLTDVCRSFQPTWAGPAFLPELSLGVRQRDFIQRGGATGLRAGVTVPLALRDQPEFGGWILGGSFSADEFRRLWAERGEAVLTFLAIGFARTRTIEPAVDRSLSPRERECLQGLARGDQLKEIASRLGVSYSTVEFHLRNARRKLKARTREQAMAQAILHGLIDP